MPGDCLSGSRGERERSRKLPASADAARGIRDPQGGSEKEDGISCARRSCPDQGIFQAMMSKVLRGWLKGKNGFL